MGKRGPPPKAPDEARLNGNPGNKRLPVELFRVRGAPFVPDHLPDDAQACMEYIIANFKTKHVSSLDSFALTAFAVAWAWHKAATHAMNAPEFEPIIEDDKGNLKVNPWFKVLDSQSMVMKAWAQKLFLTPADRMTLASVGEEAPRSKFDGLIGQNESSISLSS